MSSGSKAQVAISVTIAPPVLPVYDQPICPGDGYIWTPGYWGWAEDYYWVPGTWVLAPEVGFFWTPCWWGWDGGAFIFHEGFWGPTIGFYGGINYGFGYFGHGYEGGRWDHGHFFYNTAVNHLNVNIHNTYNARVNETVVNRVSYNGGRGGIEARPTAQEEAAARDRHIGAVAAQTQHQEAARNDPRQRFGSNHGTPPVAATARPGAFSDRGAVGGRGAGGGTSGAGGGRATHPNDLPAFERPAAPNTGNPKLDQKYQKEQDKLIQKQTQERQKLQQSQDREHQQLAGQKASDDRTAKMEQRHQQQTQQMQQRHTQQMQQMQQRQSGGGGGGHRH